MSRKLAAIALGLIISLTGMTAEVAAAAPTERRLGADLDSRPIGLADVGLWFCHDFDHPQIHCFSTGPALESAVAERLASGSVESGDFTTLAAFGPNDYVTIYSEPSYGGSYAHLSANYDQLWMIGWNDRISSYKGRNSQSGTFYSDWFGGGTVRTFCCNMTVAWMTSTYDNTFSSVYRR